MARGLLLALTFALLSSGCSDVAAPPNVRLAFDRHAATLLAGDMLATSVSVSSANGEVVSHPPLAYASSNPAIASIDSTGTVRAHIAGHATISAFLGSITDTLGVTVVWPPVSQVFFREDSLVLSVGQTFTTLATVLNSKGLWATNAVLTYASSAPGVATVEGGGAASFEPRIAAVSEGRALVTVTAEHVSDVLPVIVVRQ